MFSADSAARRVLRRARGASTQLPEVPRADDLPPLSDTDKAIVDAAMPYTMTGPHRLVALIDAVRYVVSREIPGDFAECGVWRGGSVLAMILTLQDLGRDDVDIHLYDTFEGMTEPTEHDVSRYHRDALEVWRDTRASGDRPWSELFDPQSFNEESVRATLAATGYPQERLHLVRGPVEETLPGRAPVALSLLRLDTDWYESTRHELQHLYPLLAPSGVLIIDDYGHWDGARRAVDEYFAESARPLLFNRIDYAARIAVNA